MRLYLPAAAIASIAALSVNPQLRAQAPANDDCAGAILVVNGSNGPFDQTGATDSTVATGAPAPTCVATSFNNDIWFLYPASCTGNANINMCAMTGGDTVLAVYDGTGGCAALTQLACNDDTCGLLSQVVVPVSAGQLLYIRVDSFGTGTLITNFQIDISCAPPATGDECNTASPLLPGLNAGLTNVGFTVSSPGFPCSTGLLPVKDQWWTYTATCTAPHTFSTCGSTMDTVLEVFDNCTTLTSLGCNDDSCGLQSNVTVSLTAGTTYLVRAGGWNNREGVFDIDIRPGTGNGTQAVSTVSSCAGPAPLTLTVTGDLRIAGNLTMTLTGNTGFPIVAYNFGATIALAPPCTCTVLDPSDPNFTFYPFGVSLAIPCDPNLSGITGTVQGFDLFLSPAGLQCTAGPFDLYATDIISVTLG